jgi:hypothetical protein
MEDNMSSKHYRGKKLRGPHTTHLDVPWLQSLLRDANKEPAIHGIQLGIIVPAGGRPRATHSASATTVGIRVIAFSARMKQFILLYTANPAVVAQRLGIRLKQ